MANGTTDLSLAEKKNPALKRGVHHDGGFEIDTLGDSIPKSVAKDSDAADDEIDSAYQALKLNPLNNFLDYAQYKVAAQTIIKRVRHVVYQNSSENLVQRQDTRYLGFEWVLVLQWTNETNVDNTYTKTVEEGLSIVDGRETESHFGVSASFKGLGFTAGGSTKYFTQRETSSLTSTTKVIPIPPRTTVNFYQKRYNFLAEVWFWQHVPNWQNYNHFIIGADRTYARVQRTATIEIWAEEYATLHRQLNGSTNIYAEAAPPASDDPGTVRQFTNITGQAKTQLKKWGITG